MYSAHSVCRWSAGTRKCAGYTTPSPSGRGAGGEGLITWLLSLALFSAFACVSLCRALSGHANCGCFGTVEVNPWYTAMLDTAVVIALACLRPRCALKTGYSVLCISNSRPYVRLATMLAVWLLLGLPTAFAMRDYSTAALSDAGEVIGDGNVVVLQPEKWTGKRFPLLAHIDVGERLKNGRWLVFLYNPDCASCQAMIGVLEPIAGISVFSRLRCSQRAR